MFRNTRTTTGTVTEENQDEESGETREYTGNVVSYDCVSSRTGHGAPPPPDTGPVSPETSDSQHHTCRTGGTCHTSSDIHVQNVRSNGYHQNVSATIGTSSSVILRLNKCRDSLMVYTGPGVNKRTVTENIGPGDNMSAVVTSGNNRNNGFQRNSFLRRSDSYRRAKNVLSPDLSKNNRKSVEIVTVNNNSSVVSKNNLTNGSSRQHESQPGENSDNPTTTTTSKSPIITSPPSSQNGHVVKQNEKPGTKNNFFRNLRSSFSFSSLRVKKSQARPSLNTSQISSPLEASPRLDGVTSVGGGDHYQVIMICFIYVGVTFCLHESYIHHLQLRQAATPHKGSFIYYVNTYLFF